MEMCFLSKGICDYLEVNAGAEQELIGSGCRFQIDMLLENNIMYLIKPSEVAADGRIWLRYKINGMYILSKFFRKMKPDGALLRTIIEQLIECSTEVEKYLLSQDDILVDSDYMFYDYVNKKINLICVPGYNKNLRGQLKSFLEYVMQIFDYGDREGLLEMYSIYDELCEGSTPLKNKAILSGNQGHVKNDRLSEGKAVQDEYQDEIYRLIPLTGGGLKDIVLEEGVEQIIVGRGNKETDYRIRNTQISRVHACLYRNKEGIFIEDRQSANGTYVNAVRIPVLEPQKLNKGDIVGFSNEEFFVS